MSLRRQTVLYIFGGAIQFLVDWGVMVLLSDPRLGIHVEFANIAGRIAGATLGFFLNGKLTFKADHTKVGRRQFAKFVSVWAVCTAVSTMAIHYVEQHYGLSAAQWSKPAVEFGTGIFGFLLSRHWIYHR